MALIQGINFRGTSGYISDGANEYAEIATTANFPTTTPQGLNVGWEQAPHSVADWSTSYGSKLAGAAKANAWAVSNYRVELPSAGDYEIDLALGTNSSSPNAVQSEMYDNATKFGSTIGPDTSVGGGAFYDASGVKRTSPSDWTANAVKVSRTFASTTFKLRFLSSGNQKLVAHIGVHGSAPASIDLAGNATAQATATGELTTQIPINSASVVVATASGAISTSIDMSASAVSAALATGWLHKAGGTLTELYDSMGDNVAGTVLQGNPTQSWTQRANVGMGNKIRGDFAPNYWTPSNPAFKALVPWEAATCWFVAWPGTGHAATNTGINVKRLEFWVQRESTGEWRLENASGTEIGWPTVGGAVNTRVEADGSRSFFLSGDKNGGYVGGTPYALHGSTPRFDVIDGDDIRCIYPRLEYKLILENPAGPNDMADAQIYVNIGADPWPTMSTVVGDYAPMTYAPQILSSRFELASVAPRYLQAATVNPPAQETGYPAGERSIARATFESNLPPPLMPFAADAAGQSLATGGLTTGIPLQADAAGQATATGALQSDGPELSANAAGQSTAAANLTTTITLSGAAIAQALAAAGIDTSILLASGASAQASSSADMTTGIPLQADAAGQATANADLGGAAQLSANAASSATATGELTIQIQLSAAAVAQALATASLDGGPVELAGNAAGESSASADLTTQIQLDADAASVATATGQLMASDVPLAGNAIATATATGDLNTQIRLTSTALNVVSATGDLTVFLGISAHAAALAVAGADLTTQIPLNAAAVAQVLAAANLTGGISTIKPNAAYTVKGLWRDYRVAA